MSVKTEAMGQNEFKTIDLNVRIIQAVEYCPLLYKGRATIEERQAVWQQLSQQLQVAESILKSRWHILCGYYQRCLEKRRSTDEEGNGDDGSGRSDFRYEKEMEFMMPYMHARIAIAAANAARKQQELAAAGNKELTDPEFIITEKDLENATRMNNNFGDEYIFYDVETLDGDVEGSQQTHQYHQHNMEENSQVSGDDEEEIHEQQQHHEEESMAEEIIEEVDESGNVVVQDLIVEGEELVNEDGEQIVVEEEEVVAMDDQIETVVEEIVENTPTLEEMHPHVRTSTQGEIPTQTVVMQGNGSRRIVRIPTSRSGHKFVKIMQETTQTPPLSPVTSLEHETPQQQQQHSHHHHHQLQQQREENEIVQSTPNFAQEYAVMARRRRAVVLKATPRVQVELTDNAAAVNSTPNSVDAHEEIACGSLDVAANAVVIDDSCEKEIHSRSNSTSHNKSIKRQQQQQQHHHRAQERFHVNSHDSSSDHDNRSNDSNAVTTTAVENEEDHTTKGERSEDTIFGELVTAMLKHMPQERKRAIKKSIMDLLLT